MDPQQRLMLEMAHETFENAGLTVKVLEKSQTGVYCASTYQDYDQIKSRQSVSRKAISGSNLTHQ
jgi:acyl transferase domain-containing protein